MVLSASSSHAFPEALRLPSFVPQHPAVAGVLALVSLAVLAGVAYVFQPAIAAWRRPRDHEPYTFPKYAAGASSSSSSIASSKKSTRGSSSSSSSSSSTKHPQEEDEERFPTLADPATVLLSLVIPAYNEEVRLPVMLNATLAYLEQWQKKEKTLTYELIVVDDGSSDGTVEVTKAYSRRLGSDVLRLLRLRRNRGKGGAIREGMLHTRGLYSLMVDADGATDITCLERVLSRTRAAEATTTEGTMAVGIGSRAHYEVDSVAQRAWYRTILMKGLHMLVTVLISGRIKDTQCGFKLFTRAAVKVLFGTLHLERWGFDLEIVHLCDRLGLPMAEVAVNWQEVEGSKLITNKLDVVLASVGIFRDMLCVRVCYLLGLWRTAPYSYAGLHAAAAAAAAAAGDGGKGKEKATRSGSRRNKAE